MKSARIGRCAGLDTGILKQKAAASRVHAILGKVTSSRARRPNVSIVRTAGQAKLCNVSFSTDKCVGHVATCAKFISPKPQEKRRADL